MLSTKISASGFDGALISRSAKAGAISQSKLQIESAQKRTERLTSSLARRRLETEQGLVAVAKCEALLYRELCEPVGMG